MHSEKRKIRKKNPQQKPQVQTLFPWKQLEKYSIPAMHSYKLESCHQQITIHKLEEGGEASASFAGNNADSSSQNTIP